jgi:cell wall-associated NlpC family hydrolase
MKIGKLYKWFWFAGAMIASGCAANAAIGKKPGTEVVAIAETMIGKPYRYGGSSPAGFDCSGLVQYSFTKAGYSVPRDTGSLYQKTKRVDRDELKPGDLLFFRIEGRMSHVGIYVDGDRFVHAPSSGKKVGYGSLESPYWKARFVKAGRI